MCAKRILALLAACLALALTGAGCGGGDDEEPAPAETPQAQTTPAGEEDAAEGDEHADDSSHDDPAASEPGGGTDARRGAGTGSGLALLQRVEVGRHEGYDRVVFEFEPHIPDYAVEYVAPPITADGSGDEVEVAGDAKLRVRFEPSSSYDLDAQESTFESRRLSGSDAGARMVEEVVRTGDFESVLTWVIGVSQRTDYRTMRLEDPPRFVVDLRHE